MSATVSGGESSEEYERTKTGFYKKVLQDMDRSILPGELMDARRIQTAGTFMQDISFWHAHRPTSVTQKA
jgi:hypothetical protein